MKKIKKAACIFIMLITSTSALYAQDSAKTVAIKNAVTNKQFAFVAQMALPQTGQAKQLNFDDYELKIRNDSVISYLPFFGRAYIAPFNPDDAGIKFTSVKFSYNMQPRKKGGWSIVIKPKDVSNIEELDLTVTQDANATLTVASNDKETISFNGYIKY